MIYNMNKTKLRLVLFTNTFHKEKCMSRNHNYDILNEVNYIKGECLMKLQRLLSYVRRTVDDYNMIEDGDRIAIGASGGKDSTTMLMALANLRRFYPKKFELEAITVSLGLPGSDFTPLTKLCENLGVRHTVIETDIGEILFDIRKESNPCSLCAKLRKGAFNAKVKELNCNKLAYGHNKNDVIETLFLSMFYEGRMYCFSPVTYLDRTDLTCIRPLIYVPEDDIKGFIKANNLPIVKNPCPANGNTKRQQIKEFILENALIYNNLEEKLFGAIQRSEIKGWKVGDPIGRLS